MKNVLFSEMTYLVLYLKRNTGHGLTAYGDRKNKEMLIEFEQNAQKAKDFFGTDRQVKVAGGVSNYGIKVNHQKFSEEKDFLSSLGFQLEFLLPAKGYPKRLTDGFDHPDWLDTVKLPKIISSDENGAIIAPYERTSRSGLAKQRGILFSEEFDPNIFFDIYCSKEIVV